MQSRMIFVFVFVALNIFLLKGQMLIEPGCDYYTSDSISLTFTLTGNEASNVSFFLTDDNGVIIQGPLTQPEFSGLDAGGYLVYSVTYDGVLGIESNIHDITSSSSCLALSDPYDILVCYSTEITTNDILSTISSGGNTTNTQCYTLITGNDGIIDEVQIGQDGDFGLLDPGEYFVYVYCTEDVSAPLIDEQISNISCGSCCDWSAPYSVNVEACYPPAFLGLQAGCVGEISQLESVLNAEWSSSDESVAIISQTGEITAVGPGQTTFYYEILGTTCISALSEDFVVYDTPTIVINGPSTICEGNQTQLFSNYGGDWNVSNENIISVSNSGVVTGLDVGIATITFTTDLGCESENSIVIEVVANPTVELLGDSVICVGEVAELSPTSGGIWLSSNNIIASINNSGIATGLQQGEVQFLFIELDHGCISSNTVSLNINPIPLISPIDDSEICEGETTTINSSIEGHWVSNDENVAIISDQGLITGIGQGVTNFYFVDSANFCQSENSGWLVVNDRPNIILPASTDLCIGQTTNLLPAQGGEWISSDESIALINNQGEVTALSEGIVNFTFISNNNLCSSEESSDFFIAVKDTAYIMAPDTICMGQSFLINGTHDGIWSSSDNSIVTISNTGLLTGLAPGLVEIELNTFSECVTDPTKSIYVNPLPNPSFQGATEICIGENTSLSPSTGGTWTSSDEAIGTVNNQGIIVGVSSGTVFFTYFDNVTGCSQTTSTALLVKDRPEIELIGSSLICIGGTTQFLPNSDGIWASNNPSIAAISSNGEVTGISPGSATFSYVDGLTGCTSIESTTINVESPPAVSFEGDTNICIGENSTLLPNTGGAWTSSNVSVATVTEQGVITGLTSGIVYFTFVSSSGCTNTTTIPFVVNETPQIIIDGSSTLCFGDSLQLTSYVDGLWASNNELLATINQNGIVSPVADGVVTFSFTDVNTGCTSQSPEVTILPKPEINLGGPAIICIGANTNLFPSVGGVWESLNSEVAVIDNSGQVTGLSSGYVQFVFSDLSSGCVSDTSVAIEIVSPSNLAFIGPDQICIGDSSFLSPSTGGTWTSSDDNVATVSNSGEIIGISQGMVHFTFTDANGGCSSTLENPMIVNGLPSYYSDGIPSLCLFDTLQLSPSVGGQWVSLNPHVASIDTNNQIVGLLSGEAGLLYTKESTGCVSMDTVIININGNTPTQILGDSEICVGYNTFLSPNTGGFWTSNNPAIASVNNVGVVKGLAGGKVTFTFYDSTTGCETNSNSTEVSIVHCKNPDFNVTTVSNLVTGNLSTNDNLISPLEYSPNIVLIEKPPSSIFSLEVDTNGMYVFNANKAGIYRFNVPICEIGDGLNCSESLLEITVLGDLFSMNNPVANIDFATVLNSSDPSFIAEEVLVNYLSNDKCVAVDSCIVNPSDAEVIQLPSFGNVNKDTIGNLAYLPSKNYVGYDTIGYQVCNENAICNSSFQIISISDESVNNSVVAVDDFAAALNDQTITGNLMTNDMDPEGDNISVLGQGSSGSPIIIDEGTYFIDENGNYSFTPNADFNGSLDIIYTLCDDNMDVSCRSATLHVLVFKNISLSIRVYLEGALMENKNELSLEGHPLMRDDLRVSPSTNENYIPLQDPYTISFGPFIDLYDKYNHVGPHLLEVNQQIQDSTEVFSVSGQDAIVDWVHVELRSIDDMLETIATRSGLVQRDGDVVDLDGVSPLSFQGVFIDSFYVVVNHRSHLGVMSLEVSKNDLIDFTSINFPVFEFDETFNVFTDYTGLATNNFIKNGYRACWAGDFNSDGKIKYVNPNDDLNMLFMEVLFSSDLFLSNFNGAIGYYMGDYNMNSKAKFTNPNDDQNFLFGQVLLYSNNVQFLSNYNHFIEQIPK